MKKLIYIVSLAALIFIGCNDEDEKTYDQTDLYGTWSQITPDPTSENSDSIHLEFTATEMKETTFDGQLLPSSITIEYSFDGKSFTYNLFGVEVKNEINKLNGTTLDFNAKYLGSSEHHRYTKVD